MIKCVRYFYGDFTPSQFDMLFLYVMTMLGIGNFILDKIIQHLNEKYKNN